jgi:hypothetical protein
VMRAPRGSRGWAIVSGGRRAYVLTPRSPLASPVASLISSHPLAELNDIWLFPAR